MRWLWAVAMIGVGCTPPMDGVDAGVDGGKKSVEPGPLPVPVPEEYDPCVWDGRNDDGVCTSETWIFEGAICKPACGPRARFGRPGVFATEAECKATCPCVLEKLRTWPYDPSVGYSAVGGSCDEVLAITDAGAPEVPAIRCTTGSNPWGRLEDQVCLVGASLNSRGAISKACRASVEPQVNIVLCFVEL